MTNVRVVAVLAFLLMGSLAWAKQKTEADSLQSYLARVTRSDNKNPTLANGSLWSADSPFGNLATDYKARTVGDLVIIIISEQTLAEASGAVDSQRSFAAKSGITGLAGRINTGGIDNLFSGASDSKLQGKAQTSTNSRLRKSVAGQVIAVLPNGNLVLEARRRVFMNNEKETVLLRGVARPADVSSDNAVLSTELSDLEIELRGKGVISEATRRPNWILRALLRLVGF